MIIETSIRLGVEADNRFILDVWSKCMKGIYPNYYVQDFASTSIRQYQGILSNSIVLIQHLTGEPDEIVSFLVYNSFLHNQIVHYAYTKKDARRQGKLKELLSFSNPTALPVVFTHPAKYDRVMKSISSKYIFDPSFANWK